MARAREATPARPFAYRCAAAGSAGADAVAGGAAAAAGVPGALGDTAPAGVDATVAAPWGEGPVCVEVDAGWFVGLVAGAAAGGLAAGDF